ncbi:transcriptional regulator [Paenibacillus sp. 598K]|uniref:ArsR/SmtB family transcription factor n=1 Tax=Paenibacillus sp. 598K TaxID=1117987 RepID=UPI000FFA2EEE|nr:metalloregulator ArsR/SmtB family transcription factor [Paenibacillus sp. 598K]GBF77364.1 transcriptional regulator [Paenibacillus sp. 598K]
MEPDINGLLLHEFKRNRLLLVAIGHETRQTILIALAQHAQSTGMRVGELGQYTHLSRPALSHHLKVLREAGMVSVQRKGTKNFYRLDAKSKIQDLQTLISRFVSLCE